jgi:hypothetical protein
MSHTLVIYRASEHADAVLGELARAARENGGRLTVVTLAVEEPTGRGCCDTRSVLWNRIQREFAEKDLTLARMAVEDAPEVEFGILIHSGRRVWEAVERDALRRAADEIVLADPGSCGLSRRDQRRLRASALAA